ncbi:hypothetical protein GCM10009133_16690 [Cocleimonas flava]
MALLFIFFYEKPKKLRSFISRHILIINLENYLTQEGVTDEEFTIDSIARPNSFGSNAFNRSSG